MFENDENQNDRPSTNLPTPSVMKAPKPAFPKELDLASYLDGEGSLNHKPKPLWKSAYQQNKRGFSPSDQADLDKTKEYIEHMFREWRTRGVQYLGYGILVEAQGGGSKYLNKLLVTALIQLYEEGKVKLWMMQWGGNVIKWSLTEQQPRVETLTSI